MKFLVLNENFFFGIVFLVTAVILLIGGGLWIGKSLIGCITLFVLFVLAWIGLSCGWKIEE